MPRKSNSTLSKVSRKSKSVRRARDVETNQEAEARRLIQTQRSAASRAAETPEQTSARRAADLQRHIAAIASETPVRASNRRAANLERNRAAIATESAEQGRTRRATNLQRNRAAIATESAEQGRTRRATNLQRNRAAIATESAEQGRTRRATNLQRNRAAIATESAEQGRTRRATNLQRNRAAIATESAEQGRTRRATNLQRNRAAIATESAEQGRTRRAANLQRNRAAIANETTEQANARRFADSQRHIAALAAETAQQADVRRSADLQRHVAAIAAETAQQADARRTADLTRHVAAIAVETPAHASERRSQIRERQANRRSNFLRQNWIMFHNAAFDYDSALNYWSHSQIQIGKMNQSCCYCGALKWKTETTGMCCSSGKVNLPILEEPPQPLKSLLKGESNESRQFLRQIRKYNCAFQMTSFGADREVTLPGFQPTFIIQGQIYHRIGALFPVSNQQAKFLQVYFMGDEESEAQRRCEIISGLDRNLIDGLQGMLHQHNQLLGSFKMAIEHMPNETYKIVVHSDRTPRNEHERRFNAPVVNEIAAIVVGDQHLPRDVVLHSRGDSVTRVSDTHRFYDALQYPLLFWAGQEGYHFQIPQVDPVTRACVANKKVSCMDFYAFHMMVRENNFNTLVRCRQLFHQFVVDMYVKVESERLRYISLNQTKLRVEAYVHLQDAVNNDANVNPNDVGQLVILPSSFVNSPRYLHEYTQDAFTYVRTYGRPDLFITLTCNPAWKELNEALLAGQRVIDRHDLIARVFRQKIQKLVAVLTKGNIFGEHQCFMYSVEWQKRGLPHVHLLLWLKVKIRANQIDEIISAEIPNPQLDKGLYDIVVKNMVHGPCGRHNPTSPCMKNGKCTKNFPRALLQETQHNDKGYPLYKRRAPNDGGHTAKINVRGGPPDFVIDNRWIVPYCPLLTKTFNAHINIELCSSVKAIKYICKYINKGSDQAIFDIQNEHGNLDARNEVQVFQAGRYISSNEAVWRILSFPLHERYPSVTHLAVHLEDGQRVYFNERNFQQRVSSAPTTTLTAFFELCTVDNFAKTLLYSEIPRYYTWDNSQKKWKRRKVGAIVRDWPGVRSADTLGRVYTVHLSNFECYCLRMLLHKVKGPTSFSDLKCVNGRECATFREACELLGLLENDEQWDLAMQDAVLCAFPSRLRDLFAILLTVCALSNPLELWERYKDDLAEDILRRQQLSNSDLTEFNDSIYNEALLIIEDKVIEMVGRDLSIYGIPRPERVQSASSEFTRETNYDIPALNAQIAEMMPKLLPDQKLVFDSVLTQIHKEEGALFFLDAPGGTGKTFLLNLLLAEIRKNKNVAIAVASSGIAATLLNGGRTAHSVLKLPLNLAQTETPLCNISKESDRGVLFQNCKLLVWDECTMSHKHAIEALNRTLQDIRSSATLMGGMVVLLAGDFRQTMPVIQRGTPADEINACLKSSLLWNQVKKMNLTTNMRVHIDGDAEAGAHAAELLRIGDGEILRDENGDISFKRGFCNLVPSEEALIAKVYPEINRNMTNEDWLCERALLAPKNNIVDHINEEILRKVSGDSTIYTSVDSVMNEEQCTTYPIEFLNSIELSGVPPHKLELKIGVPIILMRNLNAPKLCNGTRLRVTHLNRNIIGATILTGSGKGEDVFIPRIPLIPTDLPFQFKRLQFPLKLAFAITINKSQGQTLNIAGVHLETPCFSHGQLYVACSRVPSSRNLHIFAPDGKTRNVVYRSVLTTR